MPEEAEGMGPRALRVHRLGRVEYQDGLDLMARAAEAVRAGSPPDTDHLFLLEHPKVVTLGRAAKARNLLASPEFLAREGFEVHETDRGGDVTYHGPGQIVAYPVVDLSGRPDVHRYVADLEEAMIRTCADYGLAAGRHPEHRGAWVGPGKIGAVGVHLSRWVSSHGVALNISPDLADFRLIVPCGIADPRLSVTSLAAELAARGRAAPSLAEAEDRLATHLAALFERRREDASFDLHTVSVVARAEDGRLLLLRRSEARGGLWQPVTGRIEPGETAHSAAARELFEETGAAVPVEPLGYRHGFSLDPRLWHGGEPGLRLVEETAFVAHLGAGFTCRLSAEHVEHGWFTLAEALEKVRFAGLRRALGLAAAERAPAAATGR